MQTKLHIESVVRHLAADLAIDHYSLEYVVNRFKHEGLRFLTVTLPKFSTFLLQSIEAGEVLTIQQSGLTHFAWKGRAPRFLRGLLFDAVAGNPVATWAIRQFCEYFYKLSLEFTESELDSAQSKYVNTEIQVRNYVDKFDYEWGDALRNRFESIFPSVSALTPHGILGVQPPRDGPGAFAKSGRLCRKRKLSVNGYKRLSSTDIGSHPAAAHGLEGFFKPYPSAKIPLVAVSEEKVAEILFVPKDSRGPRTISKEPLHLLRSQLAVQDCITPLIERDSCYRVNFKSQQINQALSQEGSLRGTWSTLDLKDASDRVSLMLVRNIFRNAPGLRYFINTVRSTHARLPNGKAIKLAKFANMGSGLCFPVLALVAYLSVVTELELSGVARNVARSQVYVYGDDIIVPPRFFSLAKKGLERSGLLVNTSKSFHNGTFRESCGADFQQGISVSPVRLRLSHAGLGRVQDYREGVLSIKTHAGLLQLERHCRELVDEGLYSLSSYLYRRLEQPLGVLPYVHRDSHALGRWDPSRVLPVTPLQVWVPSVPKEFVRDACPYKGIGKVLKPSHTPDGTLESYLRAPVRRKINLQLRVVSPAVTCCFGATDWNYYA